MRKFAVDETLNIIDLRHLKSADLRPLLDSEIRLWAQRMAWDYTTSAEMVLRYIDTKILPGYAAMIDGRAAGYAFFVYEGRKGVIGDLFADTDMPLSGPEDSALNLLQKLLEHVIETLKESPGITRIEAQLLLHQEGSLIRPFLQNGFRRWTRLFMMLPLANDPVWGGWKSQPNGNHSSANFSEEIEIRRWTEEDFQPSASVITAAYRGHLDAEINDQYRGITGSLRFLNNIVRFPGCGQFDAESSFVAIHRKSNTHVGLLLCSLVKDDVGHVTQVCVVPEQQGQGLGEAMLETCCRELRRRKFTSLSLTVTEANVPAVGLYKRLGFTIEHKFDAFVWEQ